MRGGHFPLAGEGPLLVGLLRAAVDEVLAQVEGQEAVLDVPVEGMESMPEEAAGEDVELEGLAGRGSECAVRRRR